MYTVTITLILKGNTVILWKLTKAFEANFRLVITRPKDADLLN